MENPKIDISFHGIYDYINKLEDNNILISIILPVYNEEKTIRGILEKLPDDKSIEIIVIDDHSIDNSIKEIKKVMAQKDIKLIKHKTNKGYGGTLLTGIKAAQGKVIITMDSDGQHRPEDIYSLVKPILDGVADYTIGSRYMGKYHYELPITTRLGEAIVEKLILIFFKRKIMNNQNGFRAFNRKIMHIFDDIKYKGYAFGTELILKAALYDYKIKECPINLYDRAHGVSKIKLRKLTVNLFKCLFQYYIKKIRMYLYKRKNMKI
ncbi:MAG: glycosyltransferase family 2 protein [Promethearchaeota archaeon]